MLLLTPQPPPPGSNDSPWQLDLEDDFWRLKEEQLDYPQIALSICRQDNKVAQSLAEITGKETCDKKFVKHNVSSGSTSDFAQKALEFLRKSVP